MMHASMVSPLARRAAHGGSRAVHRVTFLVGRQEEGDRTGAIGHAGDALGGRDHGGHGGLHVRGTAAIEHSVTLGRDKRIARPLLHRPGGTTST